MVSFFEVNKCMRASINNILTLYRKQRSERFQTSLFIKVANMANLEKGRDWVFSFTLLIFLSYSTQCIYLFVTGRGTFWRPRAHRSWRAVFLEHGVVEVALGWGRLQFSPDLLFLICEISGKLFNFCRNAASSINGGWYLICRGLERMYLILFGTLEALNKWCFSPPSEMWNTLPCDPWFWGSLCRVKFTTLMKFFPAAEVQSVWRGKSLTQIGDGLWLRWPPPCSSQLSLLSGFMA